MNQDQKKDDLGNEKDPIANVDNVEIQPLDDEELESAVGGFCSLWSCSNVKPN